MRALESNYGFGVAEGDKLVGPDARMRLSVVNQTGVTVRPMLFTVDAFDVRGAAAVAIGIHAELILAARAADRRPCEKDLSLLSKES